MWDAWSSARVLEQWCLMSARSEHCVHCCRWALDRAACGIIRACQIASAHSLVCYVLVVLERLLKVIAGSVVVNGCCEHIPSELWLQGLCAFWAFSTSVAYFKYTCFLSLLALWHVFLFFLLLSFFFMCTDTVFVGHFFEVEAQLFLSCSLFCQCVSLGMCSGSLSVAGTVWKCTTFSLAKWVGCGGGLSFLVWCYLAQESLATLWWNCVIGFFA